MNTLERKLPIGIQTFEKMRAEGCLYVDKTAIIYQIVATKVPYFLSRPRRFGKSLLISTFEAYFQGRKDLFEGLAIEKLETKWEQYPVLHLDLNAKKYETSIWRNGKLYMVMRRKIVVLKNVLVISLSKPI